jgi:hypothetical protein
MNFGLLCDARRNPDFTSKRRHTSDADVPWIWYEHCNSARLVIEKSTVMYVGKLENDLKR